MIRAITPRDDKIAIQSAQTQSAQPERISMLETLRARTPQAQQILDNVGSEADSLRIAALGESQRPLRQNLDMSAFNEQQALLGLSGEEAQRDALANIPQNAARQEQNRRDAEALIRRMNATGDAGSGAGILATQQLAGQQQREAIQKRLNQLNPLSQLSRNIATNLSQNVERSRDRRAQARFGTGVQSGNIYLGSAAPVNTAMQGESQRLQDQYNLSGLESIGAANRRAAQAESNAQIAGAISGLAGTAIPAIGGLFG